MADEDENVEKTTEVTPEPVTKPKRKRAKQARGVEGNEERYQEHLRRIQGGK